MRSRSRPNGRQARWLLDRGWYVPLPLLEIEFGETDPQTQAGFGLELPGRATPPFASALSLLSRSGRLLLVLPVRLHDLQRMHDRQCVGHDLQPRHVDLPGLRRHSVLLARLWRAAIAHSPESGQAGT